METLTRRDFVKGTAAAAGLMAAAAVAPKAFAAEKEDGKVTPRKIVVVTGAAPDGNTVKLVESFTKGAEEAGHTVVSFFLGTMDIRCCLGCDACRYNKGCIQHDDMYEIYDALKDADMVVIASAMRYWTVTGVVKNFIERLYATCSEDKNPPYGRYELYKDYDCALLMTAADNNWWTFDQAVKYYNYALVNYLGWHSKGMVLAGGCGGCGEKKHIEDTGHLDRAFDFGKNLYKD